MYDDYYGELSLGHSGVKGMKWGVRKKRVLSRGAAALKSRSRPAAALSRAASALKMQRRAKINGLVQTAQTAIAKAKAKKQSEIKARKLSKASKNANISKLSNEELRDVITRASLEKSYRATQTSVGKKFVVGALATIGTAVAAKYTTQVIPNAIFKKTNEAAVKLDVSAKEIGSVTRL